MHKILVVSFLSLCLIVPIDGFAQSIFGVWKNVDDEDGKEKSHIEIYEEGGMVFGKVIKLLPNATLTHCPKCKDHRENQPLIGMVIIENMIKYGEKYQDGEILDPKSGKMYSCLISLKDKNTLKVRGYIGAPMFGRTQYFYRVE